MSSIAEQAPVLILAIFAIVSVMAAYRHCIETLKERLKQTEIDNAQLRAQNTDLQIQNATLLAERADG